MVTKGPLYLGVDGGGTRCHARIEDRLGVVLAKGGSGPATMRLGPDNAWRTIMRACEAAAEQAGLARQEVSPENDAVAGAQLVARGPPEPTAATVGGGSAAGFRASNPRHDRIT
jgi:glucosamine kinase